MAITKSQALEIEAEVIQAIDNHNAKITEDNYEEIIAFKTLGKDAEWAVKTVTSVTGRHYCMTTLGPECVKKLLRRS